MKFFRSLVFFLLLASNLSAQLITHWESRSPMSVKRSNLAAASAEIGDTTWIFTFMGIDSTKIWSGIQLDAYKYNTISDRWYRIADVPDTEGRIAASATAFGGKIYLIGGYKVYTSGNEYTSPRVDIYDPATDSWSLGDSVPVRTDDHVQFLYRDSVMYLISGWSQQSNTRRVQIYDPVLDSWSLASDISGPGLFGHCGAASGDTILYLDGVRISGFNFVLDNRVWMGVINRSNPTSISWTNLGAHPGSKVYRGAGFTYGHRILFTGGTNNAYNIDGIGYNNQPSVESGRTFGYNLHTSQWEEYARNPDSVMDVREVVQVGENEYYVIGGMEANQMVTNKVSVFVVDSALVGRSKPLPDPAGWRLVQVNPEGVWQLLYKGNRHPGPINLQVLDLSGREVLLERIPAPASPHTGVPISGYPSSSVGSLKIEIDLSRQPQGLYLLNLNPERMPPFSGKLLKF